MAGVSWAWSLSSKKEKNRLSLWPSTL